MAQLDKLAAPSERGNCLVDNLDDLKPLRLYQCDTVGKLPASGQTDSKNCCTARGTGARLVLCQD
eukprot:11301615-Ditylum_brightwellii.AAC.1